MLSKDLGKALERIPYALMRDRLIEPNKRR